MKPFMDRDFLLTTPTAQHLFHDIAEKMPILDYHCHISPEEIAKDRRFENMTQVWLGGDHYKWRQMRSNGIDEYYITGDAPDYEKFLKWAETLEKEWEIPCSTGAIWSCSGILGITVCWIQIRLLRSGRSAAGSFRSHL